MKIRPTGRPRLTVALECNDRVHPISLTCSGTRWMLTREEGYRLATEVVDILDRMKGE